jgi:small subunit ribosomal protein S8
MMTDPIADMLARIRNAILARHENACIPLSKLKLKIAEILKEEGYISDYAVETEKSELTVYIKYGRDQKSAIMGMRRKSRPGRRLYVGHKDLPKVKNGMGIAIVSTSRGLLTSSQAREQHVGGEVLCEVW